MLVSADSTAAFVRFVVAGQIERTTAVSGGSAVTEIPVSGLDGNTSIEAYDCATLVSCGVGAASITVDVELAPPTITAPSRNDVVGNLVTIKVKATYGAIRFFVDGAPAGKDLDSPYAKQISLKDRKDGEHILKVQQCNTGGSICEGETDTVKVIKDTKAPRWTEVGASNKTIFPVNDNYKDSTRLSARLSENVVKGSIEIRKAGGPIVRTLNLGRESSGKVSAFWNGRKANGNIVPSGRYTFRFIGEDKAGLIGRSDAKNLQISDKRLVRERVTRTLSAWGSKFDQFAGSCSSITRVGSDTVGLRSNSKRSNCTARSSTVITAHKLHIGRAFRLGDVRISALGGRTPSRPGVAGLTYYKKPGDATTRAWRLGSAWGWHSGGSLDLDDLLIRGKLYWAVYTLNGYWYDVRQFRVSYTVTRLR